MGKKHVSTFPGRYDEIKKICTYVVAGAEEAGLDESDIFHVELACDEACTNIIEHAYGDEDIGEIVVSWQVEDNHFIITLQDNGRSFNPDNVPTPTIPTEQAQQQTEADYEKLQVGGLGIHFMRKLMDEVTFHFDPDEGNTLKLIKKRPAYTHKIPVWQEPLDDNVWLVGVNGRLDQPQTQILQENLNTLLDNDRLLIIVDLSKTTYINSGGLRCLVSAWRKAKKLGGNLYLCGLTDRLEEIFSMVGFNRVFQIYPDLETAHHEIVHGES